MVLRDRTRRIPGMGDVAEGRPLTKAPSEHCRLAAALEPPRAAPGTYGVWCNRVG